VTGFGTLRGQDNIGRFGRPSANSHQDMSIGMNAMSVVQKRRRRRRLLATMETQGFAVPGTEAVTNFMPVGEKATVVGLNMYAPKTSSSNVDLPPPLSQKSPLEAAKVVPDPVLPNDNQGMMSGVGGAPMVASNMLRSFLETKGSVIKGVFGPGESGKDDGGYITTGIPGTGVPIQPSPIDLPSQKPASFLETSATTSSTTSATTSATTFATTSATTTVSSATKGFTTPLYNTQSSMSTEMQPSAAFDHLNQIARSYGIQGSVRTDQLPASLSVYGGKDFKDGAPMIPHGPGQVANGRSEMVNHALCMKACQDANSDVKDTNTEKLEKCLETCYITYAPHLYSTLPNTHTEYVFEMFCLCMFCCIVLYFVGGRHDNF